MSNTKVSGKIPTVYITPQAKQKLDLYIECAPHEIAGFGTVERVEYDFLINDVFIFEQEANTASAEIDTEEISDFLFEAIQNGADPANIKLFWHSHGSSGVFWSTVDDNTIANLSGSWMLSLVGCKDKKYKIRLDTYDFIRLTLDDLELEVYHQEDIILKKSIEDEVKKKVKPTSYKRTSYTPGYDNDYFGGYDYYSKQSCPNKFDGKKSSPANWPNIKK